MNTLSGQCCINTLKPKSCRNFSTSVLFDPYFFVLLFNSIIRFTISKNPILILNASKRLGHETVYLSLKILYCDLEIEI